MIEEPPAEEILAPAVIATEAMAAAEEPAMEVTEIQAIEPETEVETLEPFEKEGLDLPPFLAAAGAAAVGMTVADREGEGDNGSGEELPEEAVLLEQAAEDVVLPEAELEEFPFDETESEVELFPLEDAELEQPDSTPGGAGMPLAGAGTAFAATALAASELFEGEPPETAEELQAIEVPVETTDEMQAIGIPTEPELEALEVTSVEIVDGEKDLFAESAPLITEEEQVVQAHDPVEIKMRKRLDYIEGIGPVYAEKLSQVGIETTGKLLVEGVSRKGRKDIAEKSGISEHLILEWVNHVDLYRIKGVGSEYADLLEATGVDTIPELAQRRADHLYQSMVVVNEQKRLVRQMPTEQHVADWIEQAKQLPRIIQY